MENLVYAEIIKEIKKNTYDNELADIFIKRAFKSKQKVWIMKEKIIPFIKKYPMSILFAMN